MAGQMNKPLILAAAIAAFVLAWSFQELRYNSQISSIKAAHAEYVASVATAAADAVQAHAAEAQRQAKAVATIDHKYTQELANAQAESDRLRAAVRSGEQRLYINTNGSACGSGLSGTATTASMDHAASRSQLDPAAAERIIALTDKGDRAIRQLTACQAYIKSLWPDTP